MLRLILLFIALFSCTKTPSELAKWMGENDQIKILATTGIIADLVREIGGDKAQTLTLIKGEIDPHSYQLVKGDNEKLLRADIIFSNGLGLEHGASLHNFLVTEPKVVSLGDILYKKHPESIIIHNRQLDPHIWMDISLWSENISTVVEALSKLKPEHADYFSARGDKLKNEMIEAHKHALAIMHGIPAHKRYLVTSHDAFNYFARAYLAEKEEHENGSWQLRFQAPEGLAPESQLSLQDIQYIVDHVKKYDIQVLFPESNVGTDSIYKIMQAGKEKGLTINLCQSHLYCDAIGPEGYLNMIIHNAQAIAKDLK